MGEVKVIGSTKSLFCLRIEWALKLKGVEFEYLEEDLRNKSETLLKHNPIYKKIPVLLHSDKAIPESLIILEYIDELWNHKYPLLPLDPHERAVARFWAKFGDEKVMMGSFEACKALGEEKEKAIESALELLTILETQVKGKMFFGGDRIGYLDLVLGWIPIWLGVFEQVGEMRLLDSHKFPNLNEWSQRFVETPIIKECAPPKQVLVEYMTASIVYLRSLPK